MPTPIKRQKFITNADIPARQEYEIIKRTKKSDVVGIVHDGVKHRFGQGNMFKINDTGLAHAIHDEHGQGGDGDVMVVPVQSKPDINHTRTFTGLALPWHDENHKFGEGSKP